MMYVGSKRRLAPNIRDAILSHTDNRAGYWEPFCGGLNSFVVISPEFERKWATDAHEDLILMWKALQDGWEPPAEVSEELYRSLRHASPSALRGFVGFGCSFGSKWFGGYARKKEPYNFAAVVGRSLEKKRPYLRDVKFGCYPYWKIVPSYPAVIYCDPPYANTLGYKGTDTFDHERFWQWARKNAEIGSDVFVSEYHAPDDIKCIAEFDHVTKISATGKTHNKERLFKV